MPIDNSQIQTKKYHPGFFVLLAIIAVVIFSAYALTQRKNTALVPELTKTEKEILIKSLAGLEPTAPLSNNERQSVIKSVGEINKISPLSDTEKQAVINSLSGQQN